MQNPDEAIEQYQLAKKDRARLERMRHIGRHMPGPLTCDDGTRWHPTEILALVEDVERLRDAEIAELLAALKPFGAIDLVESRLPAEFAMLILRARAAIAKVRKP